MEKKNYFFSFKRKSTNIEWRQFELSLSSDTVSKP